MTDKEIIKALECCISFSPCEECPYQKILCCSIERDCLDLIKRQQAEIERLTVNMNAFGLGMKREKERADNARAEAIKEFAERLKNIDLYQYIEEFYENADLCYEIRQDWFNEHINTIVKEMTGEK